MSYRAQTVQDELATIRKAQGANQLGELIPRLFSLLVRAKAGMPAGKDPFSKGSYVRRPSHITPTQYRLKTLSSRSACLTWDSFAGCVR